jgi:ATP-binding cassette subfamily F protein uup
MAIEAQTVSGADESDSKAVIDEKSVIPETPDLVKAKPARKKMSYKHKHELEQLPAKIEVLEGEISQLQSMMAEHDFYTKDHAFVEKTIASLAATEQLLEESEERWLELEGAAE